MYESEKKRKENYLDMVSNYYAVITEPYRKKWGDYFHPAIFEDESDDIELALEKTRKMFIKDAELEDKQTIIDLGCGIGSLTSYIADAADCEITAINISDFQLKKAKKYYSRENISYQKMDIMKLNSLHKTFDAGFLIDVGCHLPDKRKAIQHIYHCLNPGGRLIMVDWLQKHKINPFEKELLIDNFNTYWNYPYMESLEGYSQIFKDIGFRIIKAEDVSEMTKKNWEIFYDVAIELINEMDFKRMLEYIQNPSILLNLKNSTIQAKNQFFANVFTKICFDAGVFRYGYFVVQK